MATQTSGLSDFFGEVSRLIQQAERLYGLANRNLTEYIIERLQYSVTVCSQLCDHMQGVSDYCRSTKELIECIKVICSKWEEYEKVLDSFITERPYRAPISMLRDCPGRPRFNISKEQLSSLSFKWSEIAVLLGISRMTIYGYVYDWDDGFF